MDKEELRKKLLEARQQYIDKNEKRLEKVKPKWDAVQALVPDVGKIKPYIEFCDSKDLNDVWWYGRVTVSSAPLSGEVGRRIHYLVRDATTGFIIGIVGLASDLTIPIRDKFIGWSNDDKWSGKRINYLMNIQHCFHPDNYVYGLSGIKRIDELSPGDLVCSITRENKLEFKPVLWVNKKTTNETMLKITTRQGASFKVTKNHHIIAAKYNHHINKKDLVCSDYIADDLNVGDYLPIPYRSHLLELNSENPEVFCRYFTDKTRKNLNKIQFKIPMDLFLRFAGWYLSEGSCAPNFVDLGQSPKSKYYEEVVKCANDIAGCLGSKVYCNANHIQISNAQFARFIKEFFGTKEDKHIPDELFNLDLSDLVDTYQKGDGCFLKTKIIMTTVSPKLLKQLVELGYRMNYGVSVRCYDASVKNGVERKKCYQISWKTFDVNKTGDILYDKVVSIDTVESPPYVVDCEVKDNHNLLIGDNYNFAFCGQCVATPELSNYLTGKLCALSTKSKEVQEHFESKYGHPLAMMTVTSLYGKSSMYNRLDGFTYLGTSKGYSSVLIPLEVKQQMREDYKKTKGKHSEIYYNEDGTVRERYGIVKGYQKLGKYAKVQSIENFRGVYVIPLADNYKEFLRRETDDLGLTNRKEFDIIVEEWRNRWFLPRKERLGVGL